MPTPIEQRKDLLEVSSDFEMMLSYRKAILQELPTMWVLIHKNSKTNNYGLEINNSFGAQCTQVEIDRVKEILRGCRSESVVASVPVVTKKVRKKKAAS